MGASKSTNKRQDKEKSNIKKEAVLEDQSSPITENE